MKTAPTWVGNAKGMSDCNFSWTWTVYKWHHTFMCLVLGWKSILIRFSLKVSMRKEKKQNKTLSYRAVICQSNLRTGFFVLSAKEPFTNPLDLFYQPVRDERRHMILFLPVLNNSPTSTAAKDLFIFCLLHFYSLDLQTITWV